MVVQCRTSHARAGSIYAGRLYVQLQISCKKVSRGPSVSYLRVTRADLAREYDQSQSESSWTPYIVNAALGAEQPDRKAALQLPLCSSDFLRAFLTKYPIPQAPLPSARDPSGMGFPVSEPQLVVN